MVKAFRVVSAITLACGLMSACSREPRPAGSRTLDLVDPVGEHDRFLGTVVIQGPPERLYKTPYTFNFQLENTFEIFDVSTSAIPTGGQTRFPVSVFKTEPQISANIKTQYCLNYRGTGETAQVAQYRLEFFNVSATGQNWEHDLAIKRIDVNHMLITREDGSTYRAPGVYTVRALPSDGCEVNVVTGAPTLTGIDVPAGAKYKIVVSAKSEEGTMLTDTRWLNF